MKKHRFLLAFVGMVSSLAVVGLSTGCGNDEEAIAATSVGSEVDDTLITARVKAALLADADMKRFDFRVETRKGEVQLNGVVQNLAQFERASEVSHSIPGVRGVQNSVGLKGNGHSVSNRMSAKP